MHGEECEYCHECLPGELKTRKKLKIQSLRAASERSSGPANTVSSADDSKEELSRAEKAQAEAEIANDNLSGLKPSTSVGSAFHSSGNCKPCAWYWHSTGCMHGEECGYCHECLPGELKMRRKMKIQSLRAASQRSSGPASTVSSADDLKEELGRAEKAQAGAESSEPCHADGEASVGSAEHARGQCRPCAFFWKPGGCQNGKDCLHCHLCAPGELQRKKKEVQQARARREQSLHGPTMNTTKQIKSALSLQQRVIQQQQQQLLQMQIQLQMQQHLQAQMMMTTAANLF